MRELLDGAENSLMALQRKMENLDFQGVYYRFSTILRREKSLQECGRVTHRPIVLPLVYFGKIENHDHIRNSSLSSW